MTQLMSLPKTSLETALLRRLLLLALKVRAHLGASEYDRLVLVESAEREATLLAYMIDQTEWSNPDNPTGPDGGDCARHPAPGRY
jgi:hypothetical protein